MFDFSNPFSSLCENKNNGMTNWILQSAEDVDKILKEINKDNINYILNKYQKIIENLAPFEKQRLSAEIDKLNKK